MTATPTEQWQCNKTLPKCLLRMLEDEIACDVTFVIGEETNEVHAHKFILMSRSPVFYSMLEGALAEKGKIVISDIQKYSFVEFLRYLYTDEYEPNSNTVMTVLYCAKKYCVDNLSKACADFLMKNISPENVCTIFQAAHRFDDKVIEDACTSVLKTSTKECLQSLDFLELSKECLSTILNLDEVTCTEEEIYESVMRWTGAECQRQGMEDSPANHRTVLGDLLYKLRFAAMDPVYFSRHIAQSCLLSDLEKINFFSYFNLKDKSLISDFASSKRFFKSYVVSRFRDVKGYWSSGDFTDKISFTLSHDATLRGIQVYGSSEDQTAIKYTLSIEDTRSYVLYTETTSITTNGSTVTYDILFTRNIQLKLGEMYTIEISQKPNPKNKLYFGIEGQASITYDMGKTVYFFSNAGSLCTNVHKGQIPGIILLT